MNISCREVVRFLLAIMVLSPEAEHKTILEGAMQYIGGIDTAALCFRQCELRPHRAAAKC